LRGAGRGITALPVPCGVVGRAPELQAVPPNPGTAAAEACARQGSGGHTQRGQPGPRVPGPRGRDRARTAALPSWAGDSPESGKSWMNPSFVRESLSQRGFRTERERSAFPRAATAFPAEAVQTQATQNHGITETSKAFPPFLC